MADVDSRKRGLNTDNSDNEEDDQIFDPMPAPPPKPKKKRGNYLESVEQNRILDTSSLLRSRRTPVLSSLRITCRSTCLTMMLCGG